MDNNNVYERIKKRDYLGAFILTLMLGIGSVWGSLVYTNNQKEKELAALHVFYQTKQDKRDIETQTRYQLVLDREREGHLAQIKLLSDKVYGITDKSEINGNLATSNEVKTKRNSKLVNKVVKSP